MNNESQVPAIKSSLNRRSFLRRAGVGAAAAMLPGGMLALSGRKANATTPAGPPQDPPLFDAEILAYALNLEYLEAEYYLYGTTGAGLAATGVAVTGRDPQGTVTVKANPQVTFTDAYIQSIMEEITTDEKNHVVALREFLGVAVIAEPNIDLLNSFNALATAANTLAGSAVLPSPFDPYANEVNFVLGGFIFEDVGVTAYHGAAPYVSGLPYASAGTGILAVEGYHAATLRTLLYEMDQQDPGAGIAAMVDAISNLRAALSGEDDDQGIVVDGDANIVPTDGNGIVFARTPRQVLNIVYGAVGASMGLFFPSGTNAVQGGKLLAKIMLPPSYV